MGSLFFSFAALLPVVAARRGGGGGSISSGDDGSSLDAPPLEIANLAAFSIFAFVTLIQLIKALPHLIRSGVRLPAAGVVGALVIMLVGYALGAGRVVARYRIDTFGDDIISSLENFSDLNITGIIFFYWGDPAMFVAVAFVLHNRYRAVQKKASVVAIIGFTSAASVLVVLMIALVAAGEGITAATNKAELHRAISVTEASNRVKTSNNCYFAFVAFHVVSMIFLAVSAFLVKTRTKNDKVMSLTLFAIVPLLLMHAVARVIFVIVEAVVIARARLVTVEVENAIDFTSTLIPGLLNVAAMSVLVFLLARPSLWSAEPLAAQDTTASRPHPSAVQGMPPLQGVMPPAQFPGQWGYPQQGPYAQQYMYVPVQLLPQNPAMLGTLLPPQIAKVETGSPQTSSQPSPQPVPVPLHPTDREPA